jgi:hypothetical protein
MCSPPPVLTVTSLVSNHQFLFLSAQSLATNKQLKQGKLTDSSYVPAGLTKAQYEQIRAKDQAKKDASYKNAVSKAFKFTDFTEWYKKRGTSEGGSWLKEAGKGHTFTKTKYDYSGTGKAPMGDAKVPEAFTVKSIFGKK